VNAIARAGGGNTALVAGRLKDENLQLTYKGGGDGVSFSAVLECK